jgi:phage shock protein PspC (stress-responsive transcriptional regulator)
LTWQLVTIGLGLSVWLQLFSAPLLRELSAADGALVVASAYLLPLLALWTSTVWRSAPVSLGAVPTSLLPGLALMPPLERLMFNDGVTLLRVGLSLLLYLAASSAGLMADPEPGESKAAQEVHEGNSDYLRVVYARAAVMVLVFVIPAYGVYGEMGVAAALSQGYGERPEVARTFIGMALFFSWSVLAYMLVMLPVLNLEYDYKQLVLWTRSAPQQWAQPRQRVVAGVWGALAVASLLGFALLRLR